MDSKNEGALQKKNTQLQKQLAEKLVELQQKNRELEIEAALEKVRARAMVMRSSSELSENSAVMFQQLKELGINAIRTSVGIFDDENEAMELWLTMLSDSQQSIKILDYVNLHIHPVFENIIPARQQNKDYAITILSGPEVKQYYQTMSSYLAEMQDMYNDKEFFYSFFFPQGALNVIAFNALSAEECNIMIRLAQAFGLVYTRFLDLQNAEEQTRLARIEAALERIRSRSMAMHKSDELKDVITVVFEKLKELNIQFDDGTSIVTFTEGSKDCTLWLAVPGMSSATSLILPFPHHTITNQHILADFWDARENGTDFYFRDYSIEEKNTYFNYVFQYADNKSIPENVRNKILETKSFAHSVALAKNSALKISSFSGKLFLDNDADILKRFGKIFEQVFIRFLDLQKAEVQAREATIEVALEKVRTTSLAMHHADELEKVVTVLFDKLAELGLSFSGAGIYLFTEGEKNIQHWIKGMQLNPVKNNLPFEEGILRNPIIGDLWRAKENGVRIFNKLYLKEDKNDFFDYISKHNDASRIPDAVKKIILDAETYTVTLAVEKNSIIGLDSWSGPVTSEEDFLVLKRFAKVFEQAYVRFLDLQKAEVQAREAQVQLALERVRARTMAMQHSEELGEAASVLFEQVKNLGIDAFITGFHIWRPDGVSTTVWVTNPGGNFVRAYVLPHTEHPFFKETYDAKERGDELFVHEAGGEFLADIYQYMTTLPDFKKFFVEVEHAGFQIPTYQINHEVFFSKGYLLFITYKPSPEAWDIFKRFGKVFEQTYTRFLDLQKAEAQVREAQIETALERIRSRTMAMQKSDELQEAANLLFLQVQALNIPAWSCGYNIWEKEEQFCTGWMSSEGSIQPSFRIPLTEYPTFIRFNESKKRGEHFYVEEVGGEALAAHYRYMLTLPDFAKIADTHVKAGFALPTFQINHVVNFKQGNLIFITGQQVPEAWDIFKRFALVFEQTYTRFLDLQKAEAQAREAQIQLALERVRARTMAMQKSDELREVVAVIYGQLQHLEFKNGACNITIMDESSGGVDWWMSGFGNSKYPESYHVSFFDHPAHLAQLSAWKSGEKFTTIEVEGKSKKEYDKVMLNQTDFKKLPEEVKIMISSLDKAIFSMAFMKYGALLWATNDISEEHANILQRFAKVFEQTYTRFLDLQKAEAQAREAQIEATLEKIRSRSLAMHNSEELRDVIATVFEKLVELKVIRGSVAIQLFDFATKDSIFWPGNALQTVLPKVHLPFDQKMMDADTCHRDLWIAKEKGKVIFNNAYSRQQKDRWFDYVFAHNDATVIEPEVKEFIRSWESHIVCFVPEKNASVFADSWDGSLFTEEELTVLKRVAKVFDQAYTRFLDLQKAEVQAREAQIQLALERLRARTMAMHKSSELAEAASVMFGQLSQLGASLWICGFNICKQDSEIVESWISPPDGSMMDAMYIPYTVDSFSTTAYQMWRNQEPMYTDINEGIELQKSQEELMTHPSMEKARNFIIESGIAVPNWVQRFAVRYTFGYLFIVTTKPFEEKDIFIRFAKVFEQTYTRFLDLQKAEAQAREARIETALEKVRSHTMAMQNSSELNGVISLLYDELKKLDDQLDRAFILTFDPKTRDSRWWMASGDQINYQSGLLVQYHEHAPFLAQLKAWDERIEKWNYTLAGKEKKEWDKFIFFQTELKQLPEIVKTNMMAFETAYLSASYQNFGSLVTGSFLPLKSEALDLLYRFAKVFEQTYTRFLDLQKAEAQAREAQIQLALERVRARTMAMQHSEELAEAAELLYREFGTLGIDTILCGYMFINEEQHTQTAWSTLPDGTLPPNYITFPLTGEPILNRRYQSWQQKTALHSQLIDGEINKSHHNFLAQHVPPEVASTIFSNMPTSIVFYNANFSSGYLMIIAVSAFSSEEEKIIIRFAKVFEQTYTRFLDLKKAEAQAREAQIELGLERVRAKAMAMQNSDELNEVIGTVFIECTKLDMILNRSIIMIYDPQTNDSRWWLANPEAPEVPMSILVKYHEYTPYLAYLNAWKEKTLRWEYLLHGEVKKNWDDFIFRETELSLLPEVVIAGMKGVEAINLNASFNNFGSLTLATEEPLSNEHFDILLRFAKVFDLTYTRFNDLKQAEAQTRESQIQLALERVRASTIAMHRSEELAETTAHLFAQLNELGIKPYRCNIAIVDEQHDRCKYWSTTKTGDVISSGYFIPLTEMPALTGMYDAWKNKQLHYKFIIAGKDRVAWTKYVAQYVSLPEYQPKQINLEQLSHEAAVFNCFMFKQGFLHIHTVEEITEADTTIIQRFANVFEQTYTRFLDLEKAEAQAREAQIEAGLERVRSRTLAMQKSDELAETAAVVFKQMILLGIEPNRLYISIINDNSGELEFWITDEDGNKVSNRYMVSANKNISLKKMYDGWAAKKKALTIDMQGKELEDWFTYWKTQFQIPFNKGPEQRRVQYISYFSKGFVAIASPDEQPEETTKLLERFADVFNLTYTRFNDLQIAEAHAIQAEEDLIKLHTEKKRAEVALTELQSTQKQLIQSEKMASLGELTAGIAHEIQNPLNFVNNFSEVNKELLAELKEEIDKGNFEDAKLIAKDIIDNEEKINLHGKRADAIVKGMLQHSSKGSGQKEPTDINALTEEFIRLCYHGLRAKDKSLPTGQSGFNATIKTDFDKSIEKINIIPQDIGRVVLNLLTNAFYAVNERKQINSNGYEPTVSVSTKKIGATVEIKVTDNGNGIPQKIVDKIFQPFFTTKPTGQGTGLGLSLSYDIVKAHGGEIKVETKDGEGCTFIIQLPLT